MQTNISSINFDYSERDKKLFQPETHKHWENISKDYNILRKKRIKKIDLVQSGSHKDWITSRVNLHVSQSLFRMLYLVEEFRNSTVSFNSVAGAALIKSIVEIPLHFGYILWVLSEIHDFEKIRTELGKIAFGNRSEKSGLTTSGKITHAELYKKSDTMIKKLFKGKDSDIQIFESMYKDANATGHHNYEARMLTGIQNKDIWKAGDRKKLFVFFSNNIFPFFMHCDAALSMSTVLLKAIDHYLKHMPTNFDK